MIIKPRIRGFICITAHPAGCARQVEKQIEYVKQNETFEGPKKVLVVGASTGYGLASRITAAFGAGAATLGVFFEKEGGKRTATAGWYNSAAFTSAAKEAGLYAKNFNGDAFSDEMKQRVVEAIKADLGQIDCLIYSLASPRRTHPQTGDALSSVIKTTGGSFSGKTVDVSTGAVSEVDIGPASEDEITQTIKVMGGEDWEMWVDALDKTGVIAPKALSVAYSYIGPEITHAIYRNGTIGKAKAHLEATAHKLNERLAARGGRALVSVNKALVTQSSSAIPVVPLYIALLYKVMKQKGIHEGCIEQTMRLFKDRLYAEGELPMDEAGRVRVDDWEMREDVQEEVVALWKQVNADNLGEISDLEGYRQEFLGLFGFGIDHVDYEADIDPCVEMKA